MALTNDEKTLHETTQREINATAQFLGNYQKVRQNGAVKTVDAYDSCHDTAVKQNKLGDTIPQALVDIFDSVGPDGKPYILGAMEAGIAGYQAAHGGEMPRADMVAAALVAGKQALTLDGYDSANGTQLNASGMESTSVVPSMTIVTIATRIAQSIPLVAYLPNPNGSNEVPIIYGRNIATHNFGEINENDYLDGPKATRQYFDPQFEFTATKDGVNAKKYTLEPTVVYGDINARTPKQGAPALPFMGGRVRVLVNGVEVANDTTRNHAKFKGKSQLVGANNLGQFIIDGVEVKLSNGEADLDANTVAVEFVNELPADAKVTINLIADYERKVNGKPVLEAPSVDVDLIASYVLAYPMRATYRATNDAINQMQRELGVDQRGAVTAVVSSKHMLEQNVRLLKMIKNRAEGFKRELIADLSRGVTDTPTFNNTAEQAREMLVTISKGKVTINAIMDVVPAGHDIYVTDNMSILFDNLSDDTHYKKIANAVGSPNQIVRIGTLPGNINVYHVPKDAGLLNEADNHSEMLLVGRSGEAARNPFVGFITNPMTVKESHTVDFETGVTMQATAASELNPIGRFADQCVVIKVTNLPVSVVGA